MITGVVRTHEPRFRLTVRGQRRRQQKVEAIVDTGYTGLLTLPPVVIATLGLRWRSFGHGILADGSELQFDVYEGTVLWDRRARRIAIYEADATPLVGMGLLDGSEL